MLTKVLFSLVISHGLLTANEIVDWDFALNSGGSSSQAIFTSVETPPDPTVNAAIAAGHFEGDLVLPGLTAQIAALNLFDGIVVRFAKTPGGTWGAAWAAQASSSQNVIINDLALSEDSNIVYVAGSYLDEVVFRPANPPVFLPDPGSGAIEGFVAKLDGNTGAWLDAYPLGDIVPRSIALDASDSFYITGSTKLAAKFDNAGNLLWDLDAGSSIISLNHIATRPAPNGEAFSYVLSTYLNPGDGSNVRVSAISPDGLLTWSKDTASPSDEIAGGLGVSRQGLISFSLASPDPQVAFEGQPLDQPGPFNTQEVYVVRIGPDGSLLWSVRAAAADATSSVMSCTDLAHDPNGNVHLAVNFNGPFAFEGRAKAGNGDAGVLSVGDGGTPYRFLASTGSSFAEARGIAAPLREEQVLVGRHQGTGNIIFGSNSLPAGAQRAFAAFTKEIPFQSCFIVRQPENDVTPPAQFLDNLRAILQGQLGVMPQLSTPAEIYREFNYPDLVQGPAGTNVGVVGYAAFLSLQDVDLLQGSGLFLVEEDPNIRTSGTISPAPYNLGKLNDSAAASPYSYTFPEMCQPVRLYLIDTAVYDPGSSYFSSNSKLTILDPIAGGYGELVRAPSDTAGIVTSEHGTNLLSLVAGPDEGVAQHTPITTKVYDIYPNVGTARASSLIDAILLARNDRLSAANELSPAVILIASNSVTPTAPGDLPALEIAIDACCAAGIPVVMSAGNNGALAASYAPAQFGNRPCVICTGGSTETGTYSALSNSGPEVKVVAPGEDTIVATEVAGSKTTTTFSGTSASAALTAGAFLQFQSANPWLYGSDLVSSFLTHSTHAAMVTHGSDSYPQVKASSTRPACHSGYTDWATWFDLANTGYTDNDDGDLYSNLEEYVHGFDPTIAETPPHGFGIDSYSAPNLEMGFPIASWLWDSSATGPNYLLRDGITTLAVSSSTDLVTFSPTTVTLTPGTDCGFQTYLSFSIDTSLTSEKFFRIESTGM